VFRHNSRREKENGRALVRENNGVGDDDRCFSRFRDDPPFTRPVAERRVGKYENSYAPLFHIIFT
jgi:hypothetical protein